MTSSLQTSVPSRKPRQRPAPSSRDQQIYLDYQTTGTRQIDLAAQFKLTQTRISQIIRRVESWLLQSSRHTPCAVTPNEVALSPGASGSPQPVGWASPTTAPDDSAARDRLQYRVHYERLNEAGRLAMQHFHEQQKIVTHKKGARAGKEFDETTERLLPPSLQCLKVIVQASAQLSRLDRSRHTPCAVTPTTPSVPVGAASPTTTPAEAPLSREQVETWLLEHNRQAARNDKVPDHWNAKDIMHDLVDNLVGEPTKGLALHALAHDAGKKVVDRKPYEDKPPRVPPVDGWYYAMYDADGCLVAWIHADQLAGAITPDYPPVSRSSPTPAPNDETRGAPDSVHDAPTDRPTSLLTASSSTSPFTTDPPQPTCTSALTPASSQTQFHPEYEPDPFDLQTIQPTFHVKGCSH